MPISKQRKKHIQHVLVEAAKLAPRYSHELGPAPGEGNPAREQESGHPGGSQEAVGLHARGGPQEPGLRGGRRVGGQSGGLKTSPDKEEQKQDHSMRRLPGPAVNRPGDGGNSRGSLRIVSGTSERVYAGDRKVDCHNGALVAQPRGGPQGVSKITLVRQAQLFILANCRRGEAPLPALGFVPEQLFLRR
jgi:hypothetical protein